MIITLTGADFSSNNISSAIMQYLDLSGLTWEQGHYDASGNDTGTSNTNYKNRLKSNIIALPEDAIGSDLYFYLDGDYEINLRGGTASNPYSFNYYLITSDRTVGDRGANSGNRGYIVSLPSNVTHIRMMLSHDDGTSNGANAVAITPSEASKANLKIGYKHWVEPTRTLSLANLTWEQGHYDNSTGQNTANTHSNYNYRLRSNVLPIPEKARGKQWCFYVNGDYEVNFHAGTSSNGTTLDNVLFNYYLITSDRSVRDRGTNSGNRGYVVSVPENATHMRLAMSHDNGSSTGGNNSTVITPSQAPNAGLVIKY